MENVSVVYIIDSNEASREVLKMYIEELNYENIKTFSNYYECAENIKSEATTPIVFIDISDYNQDVFEILEQLRLYGCKLIVTSIDYSTDNVIKALRYGAWDFLPKPIIKTDLSRALKVVNRSVIEENTSKIVTIFSNKGGIGKTTIATNLAVELAKNSSDKVALIDLNLQLGDVSTFLNLNSSFDVAYVIKNLINKKDEKILNAFEKYKDINLYILSDPSYIEQAESITPQEIEALFSILRKTFSYIIIDMSANIDENSLKILDKSDYIFFTTIVNIPAIRNTQRCLGLFDSRQYESDKVKVIVNRFMENDDIKIEDIEIALGKKVYWKIPNNYFSIMEAINKGVPVSEVNSNSNIANSFKDLAMNFSDDIAKQAILKYRGDL